MATTGLELKVGADVQGAVTGINQLNKSLKTLPQGANSASFALTNLGRVAQDAPFGFIGIQNNINPLLESFGRLKQETGSTGAALKALAGSFLGPAGLGVAISLVTSAITFFIQAKQKAKRETKELKDEEDVFVNTLAKERVQLNNLFNIATSANVPLRARTQAIKELRAQYGAYLKDFSDEEILAGKAAVAYKNLAAALISVARAKAAEAKLIEISQKQLANEEQIAKIREQAQKDAAKGGRGQIANIGGIGSTNEALLTVEQTQARIFKRARERANELRAENAALQQEAERLGQAILKNQVEPFKLTKEEIKKTTEALKEYKAGVEGVLSGYLANNAALAEQVRQQQLLNDLQRKFNELRKSGGTPNGLTNPDDPSNRSKEPRAFTKEDLELLQGVETKIINIADTINNGINAGIDQFFNAIANNQDPFEALAQSAKRLVVELGAAVVKALALQAISNIIAPGIGAGATGAIGGLFRGTVRGDQLRLLTFLRGG